MLLLRTTTPFPLATRQKPSPATWRPTRSFQSNLSFLLLHSCNYSGTHLFRTFPPPFSLLLVFIHPLPQSPAAAEAMVGLSIVLESQKGVPPSKTPQVINTTTISLLHNKPSPSNSLRPASQIPTFLAQCFLCGKTLSPGHDIYMYQGDRAFCSVECRYKQIFMDEEESFQIENCSLASMTPPPASSPIPIAPSRHRKQPRNRAKGGFAY